MIIFNYKLILDVIKLNIQDRLKLLVAFAVAGIVFSLIVNIVTTQLAERLGVIGASSIGGIVSQILSGNPMAIVMVFLTTILFGVLIWIAGFVGSKAKSFITKENVKLSARPKLLAFFIIGGLGLALFGVLDEALAPFGVNTDATTLLSDLGNPIGILIKIVAFAIYGSLAIWLGTHFSMAEKILPDSVKRI